MDQIVETVTDLNRQVAEWADRMGMDTLPLAILLFLLVFFLRKVLSGYAIRALEYIADKIQITIDDTVKEAVLPAVQALLISLALYGVLEALKLPTLLDQTLERLVVSVAIAAIFAAGYTLVDVTVGWIIYPKERIHGIQLDWLKKILKAVIVIIGLSAVLKVWDIDLGPVLTGMGVLGAGVALAAQDLFKNLIAGMASMGEKRFDIGDWVRVEGVVEGTVEKVELRSTLIRQFDQAAVHVPNAELANTTMINFTRRPYRRIRWSISVIYGTTSDQLKQIREKIEEYIEESGDFAPPERASRYVRIDKFSDSSIDILVNCFTTTIDYGQYLVSKEQLLLAIKQIIDESGTSFAYPTRTVHADVAETKSADKPVSQT
ncbi:MAG: mechanosensitive ion channel family protein [Roseibium sp.]